MTHPVQVPAINRTTTDPRIPGWHRETTFLNDYPPGPDPVVFVIGALTGTIAGLLIEQLPAAQHYLFEPQDWAAAELRQKFGQLPNVKVCEFGLGDRSGRFEMGLYGAEYCSFMRGDTPLGPRDRLFDGELVEFGAFMEREGLDEVYYASLNIEGYEFVLLPHMADSGWLEKCRTVGISWHRPCRWLGSMSASQPAVNERLGESHELVLSIDNWQSWGQS